MDTGQYAAESARDRLVKACVPPKTATFHGGVCSYEGVVSEIKVPDLRTQAFCYPWLRGCSSGCLSIVRRLDGGTGAVPRSGCHRLRLLQNSARLGVRGLPGGGDNAWAGRWRSSKQGSGLGRVKTPLNRNKSRTEGLQAWFGKAWPGRGL